MTDELAAHRGQREDEPTLAEVAFELSNRNTKILERQLWLARELTAIRDEWNAIDDAYRNGDRPTNAIVASAAAARINLVLHLAEVQS